jgi:hypothetical protein
MERRTAPSLYRPMVMSRLRAALLLLLAVAAITMAWWGMIRMPGKSFRGTPPPLTADELKLRAELMADVEKLGGQIGERNVKYYAQLQAAADFVAQSFTDAGYQPRREGYDARGKFCENIDVEIPGTTREIIVVGAHYDSVYGSPGANDNGSGVAAVLALARRFAGKPNAHTLRFAAFPNEEPLYFQTPLMGSWVYANRCKARDENIVAMISLETIGYFSNRRGSQAYPLPGLGLIYPRTGNYIAFVGNVPSRALVRQALGIFRRHATIPSEGTALPQNVPGVGWSDQWAFWQHGYPGIMVTDTAPFRYPHYHARSDLPEELEYDGFTRVVSGIEHVVRELANPAD